MMNQAPLSPRRRLQNQNSTLMARTTAIVLIPIVMNDVHVSSSVSMLVLGLDFLSYISLCVMLVYYPSSNAPCPSIIYQVNGFEISYHTMNLPACGPTRL